VPMSMAAMRMREPGSWTGQNP